MTSYKVATEVFEDLQKINLIDVNKVRLPDIKERAASVAYELSICHLQGFGCDVSYERAAQLLVKSAELGCVVALEDFYGVSGALGMVTPVSIEAQLHEVTFARAVGGYPKALGDLRRLNPSMFTSTNYKFRNKYKSMAKDVFGDHILENYDLRHPLAFVKQTSQTSEKTVFEKTDEQGLTWLHYAATTGSTEVVRLLLQQPNIDIDCCSVSNWTPLWMACAAGHHETVYLLLENNANAKIKSNLGRSCLHYLRNFEPNEVGKIAHRLLEAGVSVDAIDISEATPLYYACERVQDTESLSAVEALIRCGANPMLVPRSGVTCFDQAAAMMDANLLHALLKSPVFNGENGVLNSLSIRAKMLWKLISMPIWDRFTNGGASRQIKAKDILDMLISDDVIATYIANSPNSENPLCDACEKGCLDLIEPLLLFECIQINHFTNPQDKGRGSTLPLFRALATNHIEIVMILIEHDADITLHDSENQNVLHYAVAYVPKLLEFFLMRLKQHGCDVQAFVNAGNRANGLTPFDGAVQNGRFDLANILLEHGAQFLEFTRTVGNSLCNSLRMTVDSMRQMSYFLDMSIDQLPDLIVDNKGSTLVHYIAANIQFGKLFDK